MAVGRSPAPCPPAHGPSLPSRAGQPQPSAAPFPSSLSDQPDPTTSLADWLDPRIGFLPLSFLLPWASTTGTPSKETAPQSRFPRDLIFPEPYLALAIPHRVPFSIYKGPRSVLDAPRRRLVLAAFGARSPPWSSLCGAQRPFAITCRASPWGNEVAKFFPMPYVTLLDAHTYAELLQGRIAASARTAP